MRGTPTRLADDLHPPPVIGPPIDASSVTQFSYQDLDLDETSGRLRMRYGLDDLAFEEVVDLQVPDRAWTSAASEAARLVYMLVGVSYYKAAAPTTIDLGSTAVRPGDLEFLRTYYLDGLGEYAYRNNLDLSGLRVVGGRPADGPATYDADLFRPLVPFGGGIDSIVTATAVADRHPDAALFVATTGGRRFTPIEHAAARTGLPVLRAERTLDPKILQSGERGYRNGHVPVTGILSAIATLAAVLDGRGAVVMSNEWSSSIGNVVVGDRTINHQYSKSRTFEKSYRAVLDTAFTAPPAFFSFLRSRSELWVAERFSQLVDYHDVFRSCNRAFHIDVAQRLDRWCGRCDKCCFIDLVLAPFLPAADLAEIFAGAEPLADPSLLPRFEMLLGLSPDAKPFECVGDVTECQAAAVLASERPERAANPILAALLDRLGPSRPDPGRLMQPMGLDFVPEAYAPRDQLV